VEGRIQIAEVIQRAVKTTRQLPDSAAVRKAARLGHDPGAAQVTVGQWLDERSSASATAARSPPGPP
jgi:hypothetical protein